MKATPIPFELPRTGEYEIGIEARPDVSLIAVTGALGYQGVQAMDQYYSSHAGRASLPKITGRHLTTYNFYRSEVNGSFNSLAFAAVDFETDSNETIFGFRPGEIMVGDKIYDIQAKRELTRQRACLLFVAERIEHFLKKKTASTVDIQFVN